jgi:hypothetical protein
MRLRMFDRIRRLAHRRRPEAETGSEVPGAHGRHRGGSRRGPASGTPAGTEGLPGSARSHRMLAHAASPPPDGPPVPGASSPPATPPGRRHGGSGRSGIRGSGTPAVRAGTARARVRPAPGDPPDAAAATARPAPAATRQNWYDAQAGPGLAAAARPDALTRAGGVPRQPGEMGRPAWRGVAAALRTRLPFTAPNPRERPRTADGRRNCGSLEAIVWRQWDAAAAPPAEVVTAVDRLAELPERIKEKLAAGLDAIFVGPGGVPELDDMASLRGVRLPSGQASWDACAGAYGERKIVVGSQPSPTPDVMCHEVGHALDDLDSPQGRWQSDSAEFRILYDRCQPHLASDFHRQPGGLGRKEFFADAFAAIASRQRPALVDMLSGDTRTALRVMLFFNRRYGI